MTKQGVGRGKRATLLVLYKISTRGMVFKHRNTKKTGGSVFASYTKQTGDSVFGPMAPPFNYRLHNNNFYNKKEIN